VDHVRLSFSPDRWACLREITGADEQALEGTATVDAIRLLNGLLVEAVDGALVPGSAATLTAPDRDVLLARVYTRTFGRSIKSTVSCSHCGEPFDLDFELDQLVTNLRSLAKQEPTSAHGSEADTCTASRRPDGTFLLSDGLAFRLPTGEDECAVAGLPEDEAERELLRRCVLEDDRASSEGSSESAGRDEALQHAMADIAPTIDSDLDASCPECGEHQLLHLDLQRYLLTALRQEQDQLAWEIHQLAAAYGWSLSDILALARSQRRRLVAFAEASGPTRPGVRP
jgi:hypothetical protein